MPGIGEHAAFTAQLVLARTVCPTLATVKSTAADAVGEVSETVGQAWLHIGQRDVRGAFGEMHRETPPRLQRRRRA
ncbi:hypothetical protein B0G80_2521 [Paraburkholderia sp. BL6669N2]|nr:hypothetical protein B0G80_2521 [Paraburkholderia sp. BL6669N2]